MPKVRYKHETAFSLLPESQALPTETYRGRLTGVVEPTHGCYQSVGQTETMGNFAQGQWIVDEQWQGRIYMLRRRAH